MNTAEIRDTFNAHRASVFGWAYRVLGNREDAMDVTQDVFLKWWRANRDGATPTYPMGWLRTVTINHSINMGKSRAKTIHAAAEHAAVIRDRDAVEREETSRAVAGAMQEMSDQQRAVLFAKVYDGCTFAEIAKQLAISVPTAKTHYLRALRSARRALEEAGVIPGDMQ